MNMEKLNPAVGTALLNAVMEKYHFTQDHRETAEQAAEKLNAAVRNRTGFWYRYGQTKYETERNGGRSREVTTAEKGSGRILTAALTLGNGVDELQEQYAKKGLLLECYMTETLAGELLLLAYGLMNDRIQSITGLHVAKYHFFGSAEYPPEEMEAALAQLPGAEISCNAGFCLIPKKSVVLLAELTADENLGCAGICTGCGRTDCPNRCSGKTERERQRWPDLAGRPLPYGYMRILGGK